MLGPLEVLEDGRPLDLGAPGQRALLAFLLLYANEVVSSDRIVEALWPQQVPKTHAKTIQVYVSRLRTAFRTARGVLETRGSGYVLRVGPGELDLHVFESLLARSRGEDPAARVATLREALSLWRGAPFSDFEYDAFAQPEAARLEELRRLALEDRIEAELELGGGAELVAELQGLVAAWTLQERPRALLMRALYRAGRPQDALDVFRDGRRVLDEELGLEPGPVLRELELAVLRQDPALAAAPPVTDETRGTIVAIAESADATEALADLAGTLASGSEQRRLVLARIVESGELSSATTQLDEVRGALAARGTTVRIAAFSSLTPGDDAARLVSQQGADTLLLSTAGDPLGGPFASVFAAATCDVVSLVEAGGAVGGGPIIVPFGAFEHDWAALELGAWVAMALARPLRLIGAADEAPGGRDASRLLADASLIVQHVSGLVAEPVLGRPGSDGVAALAAGAGLLVLGLSERWRTEGLGVTRRALVARPVAPTVLVRRGLRPGGIAPRDALTRFTWSLQSPRV